VVGDAKSKTLICDMQQEVKHSYVHAKLS